ncbi:MAG: zinc ribbon domain-containing protein [Tannerella sp.]|jgi:hypothetical protein|nr:zinc ribbon domain-containing protein [Tannerella sp.]
MHKCPKCNAEFELGTKFCQNCGCNLETEYIETPTCPKCNKAFPAGTKFCDVDGSKLASPEKLIPKCVKCGREYTDGTKFCPEDGGQIIPEALKNSNDIDKIVTSIGQSFITTNSAGKIIFVLGIVAALIDVYILLNYSSSRYSVGSQLIGGIANAFPLYLKHKVIGGIIVALILSGIAKFLNRMLGQEDETKLSQLGAICASIAFYVSLVFLIVGLLAKVIVGY